MESTGVEDKGGIGEGTWGTDNPSQGPAQPGANTLRLGRSVEHLLVKTRAGPEKCLLIWRGFGLYYCAWGGSKGVAQEGLIFSGFT